MYRLFIILNLFFSTAKGQTIFVVDSSKQIYIVFKTYYNEDVTKFNIQQSSNNKNWKAIPNAVIPPDSKEGINTYVYPLEPKQNYYRVKATFKTGSVQYGQVAYMKLQ